MRRFPLCFPSLPLAFRLLLFGFVAVAVAVCYCFDHAKRRKDRSARDGTRAQRTRFGLTGEMKKATGRPPAWLLRSLRRARVPREHIRSETPLSGLSIAHDPYSVVPTRS